MNGSGPFYREYHLNDEAWKNIPEDADRWFAYNNEKESRKVIDALLGKTLPLIKQIVFADLTPRQREVIILYFQARFTQAKTAQALGITQPTVCQHLNGKKRNGKNIGGAIRRIRKKIHEKTLKSLNITPNENRMLTYLDALLYHKINRRKAIELQKALLK